MDGVLRLASAVVALCACMSACTRGPAPPSGLSRSQIVGGVPAGTGAWPAVAWLDNGCSGVLLAPDLVVFAAHCGLNVSAAWFGDALTIDVDDDTGIAPAEDSGDVVKIAASRCEAFPNWSLASDDDIAYCALEYSTIAENAVPAPLADCARDEIAVGHQVTLVGFGRDVPDDPPGEKRTVVASIVDVGEEIQIGDATHGTCAGDSGSPAFMNLGVGQAYDWRVAGILSTGLAGDGCGSGFYTDASAITAWLASVTGRMFEACTERSPAGDCLVNASDESGRPLGYPVPSSVSCESEDARAKVSADSGCNMSCRGVHPDNWPESIIIVVLGIGLLIRRYAFFQLQR